MKRLLESLKSREFRRIYYIYGKDIVSIESLVKMIVRSIVPFDDDFNIHKLDGKDLNIEEFLDVAEGYPMFAEYKCITIHDFNCDSASVDTVKELIAVLDETPKTSIIVFYVTGFDIKNGKKYPTPKNKKLIDYVSKNGTVFEAVPKNVSQTAKSIQDTCRRNGSTISYDTAKLIANRCLNDSLIIKNEIKKLIDYADGTEITTLMVNLLTCSYYDVDAFDFSRAIVSMNGQLSLKILDELYTLRAEPISVLSAVSMAFIDLYRVKSALDTGRNEGDILTDFNYRGREFVIRNYIRDARRVNINHVRDCINILERTNLALISSSIDGRVLLEKAVADMINAGYRYS